MLYIVLLSGGMEKMPFWEILVFLLLTTTHYYDWQ